MERGKQKAARVGMKEEENSGGYGQPPAAETAELGLFLGDEKKKRGGGGGGCGGAMKGCQADKCSADLSVAKQYHRRHRVCEQHAKAVAVLIAGIRQRFCQQCSRFHELSEFDETKRSCRSRLAGHNERRRKSSGESQVEASSSRRGGGAGTQLREMVCGGQMDERGRIKVTVQDNTTYKPFQIR